MSRLAAALTVAYAAVGLVTFGRAAADTQNYQDRRCQTVDQRVAQAGLRCYGEPTIDGMAAAVLWPLYWSWEAQS